MTKYLSIIAAFCAIFSATPGFAADWWFVSASGDSPDRILFFMDKESATSDGSGRTKVWSYLINERLDDKGVRKKKILDRYNCTNRTITLVSLLTYGNNDKGLKSFSWESYEQTSKDVVPDSVGESQWKFVCLGGSEGIDISISPEVFAAEVFRSSE